MELTNAKSISIPMGQKEIAIPRKQFRSAYAERLAIPFVVEKKPNKILWWSILNKLLYPLGFILLAAEIFI